MRAVAFDGPMLRERTFGKGARGTVDRPLHPNLARIAASYDEVVLAFQQGHINPAEARRRLLALVARDDTGVEWSIDPDSGRWRYRNRWGSYEEAEPPAFGMASPTPMDLGAHNRDLDERLSLHEVDMELIAPPGSLLGSTLRPAAPRKKFAFSSRQILGAVAIVATLAVLVFLAR